MASEMVLGLLMVSIIEKISFCILIEENFWDPPNAELTRMQTSLLPNEKCEYGCFSCYWW